MGGWGVSAFDPALLPEACEGCRQRAAKVDGRCPICATLAEAARAAGRPAVLPGPWPRVRVDGDDLRVATVTDLGRPPTVRVEPDPGDARALIVTALVDGVRLDGAPLEVGRRTRASSGARLEVPG